MHLFVPEREDSIAAQKEGPHSLQVVGFIFKGIQPKQAFMPVPRIDK